MYVLNPGHLPTLYSAISTALPGAVCGATRLKTRCPTGRRTEKHEEAEGVKRFERVSGKFYRRFTLPETADAEGIAARSANGILEVTIPKQPEVQPRRITVEAA